MKATLAYGIDGLYTNGFSICNIIAVIGQDKLVLVHADQLTNPAAIKDEVEWVDEPNELILIFREKWQNVLTTQMFRQLAKLLPNKKINLVKMDDEHDGVYLSFHASSANTLHPNIKKYPIHIHPDNLLRHPLEQLFLAVQKIEQIIGLRAKTETQRVRKKYLNIFDGRAWEPVGSNELMIDDSDDTTKKEIAFIKPHDSYIVIIGKLAGIAQSYHDIIKCVEDIKQFVQPIGFHLEGYLNNFDALKLFKRNLFQLTNENDKNSIFRLEQPGSNEDKEIVVGLQAALANPSSTANTFEKLLIPYKQEAPETPFKTQLTNEYTNFHKHYDERMIYTSQKEEYRAYLKKAVKHCKAAIETYQSNRFSGATNLFLEGLKLCTYCCLRIQDSLAKSYYNTGRALYQVQEYQKAKFFLNIALMIARKLCSIVRLRS